LVSRFHDLLCERVKSVNSQKLNSARLAESIRLTNIGIVGLPNGSNYLMILG